MKKIFLILGGFGAFVTGCFLNKKYGWGIGDKIADRVQSAADYVANKLEKTRGNKNEETGGSDKNAGQCESGS